MRSGIRTGFEAFLSRTRQTGNSLRWLALSLCAIGFSSPAHAERLALVIGNSAYIDAPLKNPVNDARAIEGKLKALGFRTVKYENLRRDQLSESVGRFIASIHPGDDVVVFYAGHGLQVRGVNYFPAVDARIQREDDVALNSLNLNSLLEHLEEARAGVRLLFLDACRTNPFSRSFRGGDRGLARLGEVAAGGTLIQYATKPGSVANDGAGANGLYTQQLLLALDGAGEPVEVTMKRVAASVYRASDGGQDPWVEGHLNGDFCFGGCATRPPAASRSTALVSAEAIEDQLWSTIADSRDPSDFEDYLQRYPGGRYAAVAQHKIKKLRSVEREVPGPGASTNGAGSSSLAVTGSAAPRSDVSSASSAGAGENAAVVDGRPIRKRDVEAYFELLLRSNPQIPDSVETRDKIREELIQLEILFEEAHRQRIDMRDDIRFEAALSSHRIAINRLIEEQAKAHAPTDAQIQAEYNRQRQAMGEREYKSHHILVDTEQEAWDVIAKLNNGWRFEDLAKLSKDPGSAANGGELDWATAASYVQPFADALTRLTKGRYSAAPVKTQFGYHVIRLDDVRTVTAPSLDEVKPKIVEELQRQHTKEYIDKLKQVYRTERGSSAMEFAVINGSHLRNVDVDAYLRLLRRSNPEVQDNAETRNKIQDELIQLEILFQEAHRQQIDVREDVRFEAEMTSRRVAINNLVEEQAKAHAPTDAQIQAEYDRQRTAMGEKEYKSHHILVESEQEARGIIARLDGGEKFEDLAKVSKDTGSAAKGGELDWATAAIYVQPFAEALTQLEKGKYTAVPVKTQFGYHVIRLDDVRANRPPALEQVKPQIVDGLQRQFVRDYIDQLKKVAVIN